jgi:NADH dehydrogenase
MVQPPALVFVTGASGFVGRSVAARLLEMGYRVRALVRPGSEGRLRPPGPGARGPPGFALAEPGPGRLEVRTGDVRAAAPLADAMRGCQAAIHLVGILRPKGDNTFAAVHVAGTENVIRACRACGVGRLIHMSALGAGRGVGTPYFRSKEQAEDAVRHSGADWTILRPSVIHGPHGAFMIQVARMIGRPWPVPLVGRGRQVIQPVHVEDVAELFGRALGRSATVGRTYDVGGPQVFSLRQFFATVSRVLRGRRKWMVPVPLFLVRLGAWLNEKVVKDPPITRDELTMLLAARPCSTQPMEADFGLRPARFEEALAGYAAELKAAAGLPLEGARMGPQRAQRAQR